MKQKLGLFILHFLRFCARLQIAKIKLLNPNLKIVGITGSAGKTSCLLACESALSPHFKVKTNYGGNSESGIPLSILGIKITDFKVTDWLKAMFLAKIKVLTNWQKYDILLLEMGIDSAKAPKNMEYLLTIVKPDIAIFLNVSSVHLHQFDSLNQIAKQKSLLANQAKVAIINTSDKLIKQYTTNSNSLPIIPVNIKIKDYAFPKAYDLTFGAAIKLGTLFNLPSSTLIKNIKNNFHPAPGRNTVLPGINNSTIIDSSYNSSPIATTEMLELLKTFPSPKIAVLGDMRELGKVTASSHRQLYEVALKCSDQIISVGKETTKYFGNKSIKFINYRQASDYLIKNLPPRATILVKGSQNTIFLEELVKNILANQSDSVKLCRQSPYWLKIKS